MAPMHGPTYGHGPIPFMAMAHSIHGHGAYHSWPWPYSIHGHGPIPFMAMALFHSRPSPPLMAKALSLSHHITHLAKRRHISGVAWPRRYLRVDFARIDRIRESKVAGVKGGSGGSLPSIGAIMEHHIYAYV